MSIAEGISSSLRYKAYATGVITANTQPASASDPGTSGGQILRRVSSTLSLKRASYESQEIRTDRQRADFRLGQKSVTGSIVGELSPATFFDFIEASHRDTKVSSLTLGASSLTSMAASHSGSSITFAAGDPVALGLHVGDVIRATGATVAANNSQNFLINAFGGSNNRTLTVSPAPTDQSADTSFTIVRAGCTTIVPLTGHVARKFGIEHYDSDLDISRFFTECRAAGYKITVPTTGLATFEAMFMGRDMETYSTSSAPFYASPTAATTTGVVSSVNGSLLVAGSAVGTITAFDMTMDLAPSMAEVVGQNFAAEVVLGRAKVNGNVSAYFDGVSLINDFINETEIALQVLLTSTSATNSPAISLLLPRIKFSAADLNLQGEGPQIISLPFEALLADGTVTGVKQSTIYVHDTNAV